MVFGRKKKKSFFQQEDKVNELIASYKAATNYDERVAVMEEFSTTYKVSTDALRMYLARKDVYIPKGDSTLPDHSIRFSHSTPSDESEDDDSDDDDSEDNDYVVSSYAVGNIDDYKVVKGKTRAELEENVKKWMRSGWQPFGAVGAAAFGVSPVGGNQYIQAMVKYR